MKLLSVLRHAKSNWDYPELADVDRPLLNKGVKRTLRISNALNADGNLPNLLISSPAKRAVETANIIIDKLNLSLPAPIINKHFYPGYAGNIHNELLKLSNKHNHVMIVAHNPGLTDLVYSFVKDKSIDWIPTSGLVQIQFDCESWSEIGEKNARLLRYITPKQLKVKE